MRLLAKCYYLYVRCSSLDIICGCVCTLHSFSFFIFQIPDLSATYTDDVITLFEVASLPECHFCLTSQSWYFDRNKRAEGYIGTNLLDMVELAKEHAARFRRSHPLSVVYFLDGSDEKSFNFSIQSLHEMMSRKGLSDPDSLRHIRERPIEALAEVLKHLDFYVLLVCYKCSREVYRNPDWHKLVPPLAHDALRKVSVLFLTSYESLKEFQWWFCWQTWPGVGERDLVQFFWGGEPSTDEDERIASEIVELCGNAMFELGIVRDYWNQERIELGDLVKILRNEDDWREHFDNFRKNWIETKEDQILSENFLKFKVIAYRSIKHLVLVRCVYDTFVCA